MCGFVFVRVRGVCRKVRSRSDRQSCFGPSGPATSRRPRRRAVPYGRRPIRSAAGLSLATGIDLDRGRRAAASGGEGPQFVSEPARPSQAAPRACRLQACLATKSTSVEVVRAAASRRRKPAVRIRTCAPFAGCAPSVSAGGLFCNWNRPCKRSAARSRPLAEVCNLAQLESKPTARLRADIASERRIAATFPQARSCVPSAGCVPRIQVGCKATAGQTTQRYEPGADFPTFRGLFSPGAPRRPRKV